VIRPLRVHVHASVPEPVDDRLIRPQDALQRFNAGNVVVRVQTSADSCSDIDLSILLTSSSLRLNISRSVYSSTAACRRRESSRREPASRTADEPEPSR
jgi:hypothetical protein